MKPITIQEIENRKSTRVFLDKPIDNEVINEILNACIQAPTAGNMTLYSIIKITDKVKLEQLSVLCDNQQFIQNSKLTLVFVSDQTRWYNAYNKFVEGANKVEPTIADYFLGVSDALIASENAVIAAQSLGIGSCYIGDIVENFEKVKVLLNLPKFVVPVCMLVFGYPTEQQQLRKKPSRFDIQDIVYDNSYPEFKDTDILKIFSRRINKDFPSLDGRALIEKTIDSISNQYHRKQNAEFFKEMIRSLNKIMEEFK